MRRQMWYYVGCATFSSTATFGGSVVAWEQRGTRSYFYSARRIGGRVVKLYAGPGQRGEVAEAFDAFQRQERERQAQERQRFLAGQLAQNRELDRLHRLTDLWTAAVLLACGFHRARRQWRRRRKVMIMTRKKPKAANPAALSLWSEEEFQALVQRADAGDAKALATLRGACDDPMVIAKLGGDLARLTKISLVEEGSLTPSAKEGVYAKLRRLTAELSGPSPSPVECLVIDRLLVSWLRVYLLEVREAQYPAKDLARGKYVQQCLTLADRRLHTAIRSLALVRKASAPIVLAGVIEGRPTAPPAFPAPAEPEGPAPWLGQGGRARI